MTRAADRLGSSGSAHRILERLREQRLFFTLVCIPVISAMILIASRVAIVFEYYDPTTGPSFYAAHNQVREDLSCLVKEVQHYKEEHKALPATLVDTGLSHFRAEDPHRAFDAADDPVDPWGRPYLYYPNGNDFEVKTLGRDGVPGGHGLDADMSGLRDNPAVFPTLAEFVADRTGIDGEMQCRVLGMMLLCTSTVALTYGFAIRSRLRTRNQKLTVLWLLKTTFLAALFLLGLPGVLLALFVVFYVMFSVVLFYGRLIYLYWLGDPSQIPPIMDGH